MKKIFTLVFLILLCNSCSRKEEAPHKKLASLEPVTKTAQTQVLTLGSFHFNFPNLDVVKTASSNQIDVLEAQYQKEIEVIVAKLAAFKPTTIVIERLPEKQKLYDSLYTAYLAGKHILSRSEEQQIGFRLAKKMRLTTLFCTDAWGADYEQILQLTDGDNKMSKEKFWNYFYKNPDSTIYSYRNEKRLFKQEGIIAELKRINTEEYNKKGLGDYLIGIFKYETEDYEQLGPDFVSSWWFNRNLRIFRNIQRIDTSPEDRIVVIYGAGHMNLLNIFFDSSPEYDLLDVNDFLE